MIIKSGVTGLFRLHRFLFKPANYQYTARHFASAVCTLANYLLPDALPLVPPVPVPGVLPVLPVVPPVVPLPPVPLELLLGEVLLVPPVPLVLGVVVVLEPLGVVVVVLLVPPALPLVVVSVLLVPPAPPVVGLAVPLVLGVVVVVLAVPLELGVVVVVVLVLGAPPCELDSSFLPHALNATVATSAASKTECFILVPLKKLLAKIERLLCAGSLP